MMPPIILEPYETMFKVYWRSRKDIQVISVSCKCPGGKEPSACKHALALLYAVENYSQKELYAAPTDCLQRWHQPKLKRCKPVNFTKSNPLIGSNLSREVNFDALQNLSLIAAIFDVVENLQLNNNDIAYRKSLPLPAMVCIEKKFNLPPLLDFDEIVFLHSKILKNINECINIEYLTMSQSNSDVWKAERAIRVTASNFYTICVRKRDFEVLAERLFKGHFKNLSHIPAIAHGLNLEEKIRNIISHKFCTYVTRKTGLVINPLFPFLGASPDGLLFNELDCFLIEIKCVFNPKRLSLHDLCRERDGFCLAFDEENNKFNLKNTHKYMYQIQGQMAITNISKCLFVLMYNETEVLFFETIKLNQCFWNEMFIKLNEFFFKAYLSYLVKNT